MQTKPANYRIAQVALAIILFAITYSCKKDTSNEKSSQPIASKAVGSADAESLNSSELVNPPYNLDVILRGVKKISDDDDDRKFRNEGKKEGRFEETSFGILKFRQENDGSRIINLDIRVRGLMPNQQFHLQRAVDAINVVDGNCTSTTWLTLGDGLAPHAIQTDEDGDGKAHLWRSVAAIPSGSKFDIHFRVIDANNLVVLSSDCYQYTVR